MKPAARLPCCALIFLAACVVPETTRDAADPPAPDWEWQHYLGDRARSHHSPLAQINRSNVAQLEVAWTYDTGALESVFSEIQCNPIVVDGVLYGTTPRAEVFGLDAATGREIWRFDPAAHGGAAQGKTRGVALWKTGDQARILLTAGPDLWALDARTGEPVESFGDAGRVDLRDGLPHGRDSSFVSATTPGVVYRDLFILGTRVSEDASAAPGEVRAYDLHTGAVRWVFHTIPHPDEFGADSWPEGAWRTHGGANSWAGITLDSDSVGCELGSPA